jgi:hypothetical protein
MNSGRETLESRMMRKYQVRFGGRRMEKGRSRLPSGPENSDTRRYLASRLPNYTPGANSVLCRLTIRLPDGTTVTKTDAGGYAGMPDSGDDDKSGFSDGFKRAAAKFGVARYLYRDGVPSFVREREPAAVANGTPAPLAEPSPAPAPAPAPEERSRASAPRDTAPKTGRALFAWTKEQEQRHEVGLLKYLNSWAKLQDFPGRMVDWDAEQVSLAYSEALRKLQAIGTGASEAYEEALSN